MFRSPRSHQDLAFEDLSADELLTDLGFTQVAIRPRIFYSLGLFAILVIAVVCIRLILIGPVSYAEYRDRSLANLERREVDPAPRGVITDRYGTIVADNQPSFLAFLRLDAFLAASSSRDEITKNIADILNLSAENIDRLVFEGVGKEKREILLSEELSEDQIAAFEASPELPIVVQSGFKRYYKYGPSFSTVLGYTGRVDPDDLKRNPDLKNEFIIGKSGVEAYYDDILRGQHGYTTERQDALGNSLNQAESVPPISGKSLTLTIDGELQRYFYERLNSGLHSLGRRAGAGLAINPQTGEVLAMVSLPTYDNNILASSGRNEEKQEILSDPSYPFFNRIVSGLYSPGSTIKPLVAVAALKEKVITPERSIYSPGYLDVPNPYDPSRPSRFLDWRPQGYVNVMSAIAQSSNVYFYYVGGGFDDVKGLGVSHLLAWWEMFGLGKPTGIDFFGESQGRLPEPDESEKLRGRPWLLGDTYNVSIGQGDLQITPLELLNYISAIANGGTLYRPSISKELKPEVLNDLTYLAPEIRWAQKGMELGVTSKLGTSHSLESLPISIAAKTGTAQVNNNRSENAFFVGYAPTEKPEIAILVLVEDAKQGSLNAVPIAKDIFQWYYLHRVASKDASRSM